jgi:hypothetical protein
MAKLPPVRFPVIQPFVLVDAGDQVDQAGGVFAERGFDALAHHRHIVQGLDAGQARELAESCRHGSPCTPTAAVRTIASCWLECWATASSTAER